MKHPPDSKNNTDKLWNSTFEKQYAVPLFRPPHREVDEHAAVKLYSLILVSKDTPDSQARGREKGRTQVTTAGRENHRE